jgi:hypothetical protein
MKNRHHTIFVSFIFLISSEFFRGVLAASATPLPMPEIHATIEGSIIERPVIEEIHGGINPDFFGYRISGDIFKAANPCLAQNIEVHLESFLHENTLYVIPLRLLSPSPAESCGMVHEPVYSSRQIDLRYSRSEVKQIIIKNIGDTREELMIEP